MEGSTAFQQEGSRRDRLQDASRRRGEITIVVINGLKKPYQVGDRIFLHSQTEAIGSCKLQKCQLKMREVMGKKTCIRLVCILKELFPKSFIPGCWPKLLLIGYMMSCFSGIGK